MIETATANMGAHSIIFVQQWDSFAELGLYVALYLGRLTINF